MDNSFHLALLFVLMIVNRGIEARKWQILVSRIQDISFFTAYKAVLSGISVSLFVLNGIGEYAGRIVYMREGNRLRSIALTVVGSMAQLIVTLIAGLLAMLWMKNSTWQQLDGGLSMYWINGIIFVVSMCTLLMLLIYFKIKWLTIMFEKIPIVYKYRFMLEYLESIGRRDLTRILLLSLWRYSVFIMQYLIMLHIFNVQIDIIHAICATAVLFFVMAVLPTIPVADLGVRGSAALQLFGMFTDNQLGIIATTTGIWLVNLIIPAVAGSLFMLGIKLFRNRQK